MSSREDRMRAIKLYVKYDKCAADVARELGYPDRKSLRENVRTPVAQLAPEYSLPVSSAV